MSGRGTKEDPYTVADIDADRAWRWCKCCACAQVKQCTPQMDFWSPCNENAKGEVCGVPRLLCDPCHNARLINELGFSGVIDVRPHDQQRLERTDN